MITSLAERLEQKGYNRALELVKRAEERAEAEKQRATHKARLKTAISMRKKGLDLLQIPNPRLIQPRYNFQLAI
ncbi:MAG: hypothetical protein H7A25_08090 [Leptospiraceae bacterium]|nr:hypothetical protein [Leptospiraceae bacterium]MCP5499846.1 hypothetical protein [Leptospiraceae bacterium]